MAIVGANAPVPTDRDRDGIPAEIERDQWGRPLILQLDSDGNVCRYTSGKHEGEPVKIGYTRASGLGGVLEDSTTLTAWKLRTAVFGLARSRPQIVAAASIPTTTEKADKKALDKIVERAHILAGNDDKSTLGTALHALGERLDRGEEVPDIGEDRWALKAYQEVMTRCFRVLRSEAFVAHDGLQAAGTFDRLVELLCPMQLPDGSWLPAGTVVVLDIKTSGSSQYFGIKFAVQLAVYQGACLYDAATGRRTPLGAHPDWAVILHVPSGGNMAELFWVDLRAGRELAEMAVAVKQARKRKGLVVPAALPALPEAVEPAPPADERWRILVTGSRDWSDRAAIERALGQALVDLTGTVDVEPHIASLVTVVHGGARGADTIAGEVAAALGCVVEVYEADWSQGKGAGPVRNDRMVALGARLCLAFPRGESRGTRDCMARAEAAGIPVRVVEPARPFADPYELAPGRLAIEIGAGAPLKPAHAGAISSGLMQAHARRQLLGLIGRVASEAEALQLWQANGRVWTEEHNEAVRQRLAELRAHGVAS